MGGAWGVAYFAEVGDLDVHASSQPSSQVGGASEDIAEVGIPHEFCPIFLHELLHLCPQSGR